jgi:ureidoglycolate lyase
MPVYIRTEPLTVASFAPFGQAFEAPGVPSRTGPLAELANERPGAVPVLTMTRGRPVSLPFEISALERHPHSTQAFIPMSVREFLVVVAPTCPDGSPDLGGVRAFVGVRGQAVNYRTAVWHAGFELLGADGDYAVLIWKDNSSEDTVVVDLPAPVVVKI